MITKHHLGGVLLVPLLAFQGLRARKVVPKLPEPPCPRRGATGNGSKLRLLVLGDSAAAGVGVAAQKDALAGQILAGLSDHYRVDWCVEARTGANTARTLQSLAALPREPFDVAVVSLGVNDITSGVRLDVWLSQQRALVQLLGERFGIRHVILSALPPVRHFPALPQPLRWFLGSRALYFDEALARLAAVTPGCDYVKPDFSFDASIMASDGFHPGAGVYRVWGAAVASAIRQRPPPVRPTQAI